MNEFGKKIILAAVFGVAVGLTYVLFEYHENRFKLRRAQNTEQTSSRNTASTSGERPGVFSRTRSNLRS